MGKGTWVAAVRLVERMRPPAELAATDERRRAPAAHAHVPTY